MSHAPIQPGVSPEAVVSHPLSPATLRSAIDAVGAPLAEAFVVRLGVLRGPDPIAEPRAVQLLALQRLALDLPDEPERTAQALISGLTGDFTSDAGAHDVVQASEAYSWALRDVLGPQFGPDASAMVDEAQHMLRGLTQRLVRHQTGEFPTDPRFQRRG